MKNKYLISLFYLIFCVFNSVAQANEITFETDEIEVLDNGNKIITSEGLARSTEDNLEIKADRFDYNKNLSVLNANGNGLAKFKNDNIEIESDNFYFNQKKSILKANGNVRVKDLTNNFLLMSNEIIYDTKNKEIESKSTSKIKDDFGNLFLSENFVFILNENLIKFEDLELIDNQNNKLKTDKAFVNTVSKKLIGKDISIDFNNKSFQKDNEPRLKGNTIISDTNQTIIKKGVFTTCKKNDDCPPWQLSAKEIRHDKSKKMVYYKEAWLKIYDKPVFYFPKFFHPDPTVKRQSGFLMPTFEDSSLLGGSFQLPYYHVISDNKDFTLKSRFYNEDRLSLQSEYRQANKNSDHILDFSFTGEKDISSKNHFFLKTIKRLNFSYFEESDLDFQIQHVSNDTYLKTFKFESPIIKDYDILTSSVKIKASKEDLFLDLDFSVFEDLSKKQNDRYEYIFPSYNLLKIFDNNEEYNGTFSLNSSGNIKNYNTNVLEKVVINDLHYNSNYIITDSGIRNGYNFLIKNVNSNGENSLNYKNKLNQQLFSLAEYNSSYPLKKRTAKYNNILNPSISLRYSPSETKNLRNKESRIDTNNVFSLNRMSINDSIESGASLTYGTEFKKTNEQELDIIDAKIANIVRLKEEKKLPGNSSIGKKTSDIFGSINYNPNKYIGTGYDFARKSNLRDNSYEILKGQLNINNFVTSFEYLNENNTSAQQSFITNNTSYKLNDTASLIFETRKNKKTRLTEFYNLIYQYRNDCLTAAIEYNKDYYTDRDLKPSENIFIKLTIIPFGETSSPNLKQ